MLADVAAIGLAVFVARMAQRPATPARTYGLVRLEILAALVNGAMLIVIAGGIGVEALRRFRTPLLVHGAPVVGIAMVGLLANLASMRILHHGHAHSLNQRGAYLHVVSDALGSVGALAVGVIVLMTGWTLADPIVSVAIAALILGSAWRLMRESADILLEAAPGHIPLATVHDQLASIPGVRSVHDLHVWTLTSGMIAMSGHLVVRDPTVHQRVLEAAQDRLRSLGIHHVTVQMEKDETCE
jgi:cobalt-zinc-cadmium efflux system protein